MVLSNKRGLQQADWAISMGIFVIYLVVFFIAVKPLLTPPSKLDSLTSELEDRFTDNTTVTVERVPIVVRESLDNQYEPIVVDLPYSWDPDNMVVSEGYFVFDSGKLLFLANRSDTGNYTVSHSIDIHESSPEAGLISNSDQADVETFRVELSESIPSRYTYRGDVRIGSFNLYIDGESFDRHSDYTSYTSIAKYLGSGVMNHTTYVFANNPRTYTYISPVDHQPHNISIQIDLYNYSEYYVDVSSFGDIVYTTYRCKSFSIDSIDLSDGSTGVAFYFKEDYDVELCNNETELWMTIDLEINSTEEASYLIFLHQGDYTEVENYPANPLLGFKQELLSTSYGAVSSLAVEDYDDLKARWGVPYYHDFQIIFTSDYYNATIGDEPPLVDVYAKELRLFNFDGVDFEEVNAVLAIWGGS